MIGNEPPLECLTTARRFHSALIKLGVPEKCAYKPPVEHAGRARIAYTTGGGDAYVDVSPGEIEWRIGNGGTTETVLLSGDDDVDEAAAKFRDLLWSLPG